MKGKKDIQRYHRAPDAARTATAGSLWEAMSNFVLTHRTPYLFKEDAWLSSSKSEEFSVNLQLQFLFTMKPKYHCSLPEHIKPFMQKTDFYDIANVSQNLDVLLCLGCYHKIPKAGQLINARDMSHSSEGWKRRIRVPAWLDPCETLFWVADGWLVPMSSRGDRSQAAFWGLFYKGTNPIYEGFILMTSAPPKAPTHFGHQVSR